MVFLWDKRVPKPVNCFKTFKMQGKTLDIRNGSVLVGSTDSTQPLSLWNIKTGSKIPFKHIHLTEKPQGLCMTSKYLSDNMDIVAGFANPNIL